jgi:hypothetical protein
LKSDISNAAKSIMDAQAVNARQSVNGRGDRFVGDGTDGSDIISPHRWITFEKRMQRFSKLIRSNSIVVRFVFHPQ